MVVASEVPLIFWKRHMLWRGDEIAVWGPSPGFRDLRWIKPVLAGDVVDYVSVVIDKRSSASRPGWGILTARTIGTNQRGEEVYSITATAFVPMRKGG